MATVERYNLENNKENFTKIITQNDLFATIVQKLHDKHEFNVSFMLYCFRNSNSKYYNLRYYILDNNFVPNNIKDIILLLFCEANRVFQGFMKLKRLIIRRKAIKYSGNTDLLLRSLDSYSEKFIIELLENNTVYKFYINDLLRLWQTCLTDHDDLFPKPKKIYNPYTNIPFAYCNILNIYYHALANNIRVPTEIILFRNCEFKFEKFLSTHYEFLFVKTTCSYVLEGHLELYADLIYIKEMYSNHLKSITIPKPETISLSEKLLIITKMNVILKYYYLKTYVNTMYNKSYYERLFYIELKTFNRLNVGFGRLIYKRNPESNKLCTTLHIN